MHGLMIDEPLLISSILEHSATVHATTEIVARTPAGGTHRTTYGEAHRRAKQLAQALTALGMRPGDRVGSLAWNTHHHFELFYGASGTGAILHTINPRLFDEHLVYIINHAEDRWICVDAATLANAERIAPQVPGVRGWIHMSVDPRSPKSFLPGLMSYERLLAAQDGNYDWTSFDERKASVICYTSGTTGQPKGVVNIHRSTLLGALVMSTADRWAATARARGGAMLGDRGAGRDALHHAAWRRRPAVRRAPGPQAPAGPHRVHDQASHRRRQDPAARRRGVRPSAGARSVHRRRLSQARRADDGWLAADRRRGATVSRRHAGNRRPLKGRDQVGRQDQQRHRGEAAIGHPPVAKAAMIGIAHPRWQERPLLVVVRRPDKDVTCEELIEFLRPQMASWWLPDDVTFVEALPMTATGKIHKVSLRERFMDLVSIAAD